MSERAPLRTRPATRERHAGGAYFRPPEDEIEFIPTGSKMLNLALGGGWANGRTINIVGDRSSGKTLLVTEAATNYRIKYPRRKIRYRETERAFLMSYARNIGAPVDSIDFGKSDAPMRTVEDLYEELAYRVGRVEHGGEMFIVDSLDALTSRAALKRTLDQGSYGVERAKLMSKLFQDLNDPMERAGITLIIISQLRDKINAMFGRKSTRNGGRALDFYASQIVWLAQLGKIKAKVSGIERPVGIRIKAQTDKNKVGLPFREVEFPILFSWGMDDVASCIDWLKSTGGVDDALNGMSPDSFRKMVRNGDGDWKRAIERMHMVVDERWNKIESSFMPPRPKYG